jgi:ubiquinone/menaquinone biosynthesis C-methylase UbiE
MVKSEELRMASKMADDVKLQRDYYAETAKKYDQMREHEEPSVGMALDFMMSSLDRLGIRSILDIGSGTGRGLNYIKEQRPDIRSVGVEPVAELRAIGHSKGISTEDLVNGDATRLSYGDGEFDLVCEIGILHHIRRPDLAVSEMLRVARKAIFICDDNNFGQGSLLSRSIKQMLNSLGLWKAADYIKTGGKGYTITEGDGLGYSYSVFNDYRQIRAACRCVHMLNTNDANFNLYRTARGVALLGIKK